jgi:hypothetical protein
MLYQDDLISEWGDDKPRQHLEDDLQAKVCVMLKWGLPHDATSWACPNGGKRHKLEAARMTRLGVRSGVPDLHIVYRGRLHCMELKSPTGQLSATQHQMIDKLQVCGVPTVIIRKPEDVVMALTHWGIPFSLRLS